MKTVVTLLFALVASLGYVQPAPAGDGRLVYQIEVTNPGTKSQGWRGTLYDQSGTPMEIAASATVETGAGTFVSVACTPLPWYPCGMIHAHMVAWMKQHNGNVPMDGEDWAYRLYVTAEGTRSEGWRGELLHGGGTVPAQADGKPMQTPLGPFLWLESPTLWGDHGWFHVAWTG